MSSIVEKIDNIEVCKEVLGAMPQNNKKNIDAYENKLLETKQEYEQIEKALLEEIKNRYENAIDIKDNDSLKTIEEALNNSNSVLYLLNDKDTSYEKMDLDKAIHKLHYYYKNNLEAVNDSISYCLKKFEEVGVEIKKEDVPYCKYVKEYISVILGDIEEGGNVAETVKEKFEEIYWKCPSLITYIELNLRLLYFKNEKKIDKYYLNKKNNLVCKFTKEELISRRDELKIQLDNEKKKDTKKIILDFINGNTATKDFSNSVISAKYMKFVPSYDKNMNEEEINKIDSNLDKLLKSLYEYKNYLKFKFIVDDIKKIFDQKDQYKNVFNQTKKEIEKTEKKVILLSKIVDKSKNGTSNKEMELEKLISNLHDLYKKLDYDKICNKVATELNDSSTIKDALVLAHSFYGYMFSCMLNSKKDIEEAEIDGLIEEMQEFINSPYNTMINNIKLQSDSNMMLIVKDRYNLLDINITRDDLAEENLDILISILKAIQIYHCIRVNKIDIDELGNINEFRKIIEKNK